MRKSSTGSRPSFLDHALINSVGQPNVRRLFLHLRIVTGDVCYEFIHIVFKGW